MADFAQIQIKYELLDKLKYAEDKSGVLRDFLKSYAR